jgi:tetratricopeptide (TPR) repeat protein
MSRLEEAGALFLEALELPPGTDRDGWLEARAGADPALLAQLRRLLEAHEAVEAEADPLALLARGVEAGKAARLLEWADTVPRASAPPLEFEIGEMVGRYRILGPLGKGGMGSVWRAHDPLLGREVALKFLRTHDENRARLLEEARAAASLDHPCIGTLYEVGEDEAGRVFLAMASYSGGTVRERLRKGPIPVEEAVRIAVQVADALDTAHRAGVIHRDVKPENLVLDADGRVKVVDFGIALSAGGEGGSGSTGGTLLYMSPEQLEGGEVDGRADLWALGVVLYEMLTGAPPWEGEDRVAILRSMRQRHRPPSGSASTAAAKATSSAPSMPPLPPPLERVVDALLEPDPSRRIPTGKEVARRLREATRPDPSLGELVRRGSPRGRMTLVALALLLFLGGGLATRQLPRLASATGGGAGTLAGAGTLVVATVTAPETLEEVALAAREALVVDLEQSGFVRVLDRAGTARTLERMALPAETPVEGSLALELAERAGAGALLEVSVTRPGGRYLLAGRALDPATGSELLTARVTTGEWGLVRGVERLSRELRRRLGEAGASLDRSRPLPEVTTASLPALRLYARAEALINTDPERALALLEEAVALDPGFAMAHRLAAAAASGGLNFAAASHHSSQAYALRDRLPERERWHVEGIHAIQSDFDPWLARERFERLKTLHPGDFRAHWNLGITLRGWFDGEAEAARAFTDAMALDAMGGVFHITTALTFLGQGDDTGAAHHAAQAEAQGLDAPVRRYRVIEAMIREDREEVAARCDALFAAGEPSPLEVDDRELCGSVLLALGEVDAALPILSEATRRTAAEGRWRNRAHVGQALATALVLAGRPDEARAALEATVQAIPVEGFPDPDRYLTRVNLATHAALLGWPDLARSIRSRYPDHPDPEHWFVRAGESLVDAALALDRGDGTGALRLLELGFPPDIIPEGWRTWREVIRARAHTLAGNPHAAREEWTRAATLRRAVKAYQTKDRMHVPLARDALLGVAAEEVQN